MAATSRFSFGDVVLVPFPFTDQSGTKKRPAVVVSSQGYNANRRDIVIMAITSQVRTPLGFGESMVADWQGAGLVKESVLKPVFTTIEQGLVIRVMGHLSADARKRLAVLIYSDKVHSMSDWSRLLRSPNNVKRYFSAGVPALSQLRLLRVVIGPGAVKVALGFPGIPAGATDKWRRSGYTAVDLILRLSKATIEHMDSAALLLEQADVSVDLSQSQSWPRKSAQSDKWKLCFL
ncbi:MAG: type II toxin-antitoxin system PemK/MazF family toxin [Betaproteobacteria bacterium]